MDKQKKMKMKKKKKRRMMTMTMTMTTTMMSRAGKWTSSTVGGGCVSRRASKA